MSSPPASQAAQDEINLSNPTFFGTSDPHPIWRRLRAEDPVHLTKSRLKKPFWSVTSYAAAKFVLMNDNGIFSVQRSGANLPMGPEFEDPENSLFTELTQSGSQLAVMDGQPHTMLRRFFADWFNSSSIRKLEHRIREITHDALDRLIERGEGDFTTDFAGRVPTAVIASMMEIPLSLWDDLYLWNNMMAAPEDPEFSIGDPVATSTHGVSKIIETCAMLANERRGSDRTDLLTAMTRAEVNGRPLTEIEIGFNSLMFFGAGHETTRSSMSTGLIEMLRDPAQLDYLRRNRHDAKALQIAADEFVRLSAPLTHTLRTATEDVTLGDKEVKEGDWVVIWFHAANRDGAVFESPECFNVKRSPNPHLGFAVGKHFCLGAHLARADMKIMLEAMLDRMDNIEISGPVEMASSNLFWGVKHMPIKFTGRPRSTMTEAA